MVKERLRRWLLLTTALLFFPAAAARGEAPPVQPGTDRTTVIEKLGEPKGRVASNDYEILYYSNGSLELRNGAVEKVGLVSETEARERHRTRRERLEAHRAEQEAARMERIKEGEQVREERIRVPAFSDKPPREQFAILKAFREEYPEVDVMFEYRSARNLVGEEERAEERAREKERERWRHERILEREKAEAMQRTSRVTTYREARTHYPASRRIVIHRPALISHEYNRRSTRHVVIIR